MVQRVVMARALAQEPTLMVLDEPTAFLDVVAKMTLLDLLMGWVRGGRRSALLSTHDIDGALRAADRMIVLHPGGGATCGVPEDLARTGALEEAFRDPSQGSGLLRLDPATGGIQVPVSTRGRVRCQGRGAAMLWLKRALIRKGLQPTEDGEGLPLIEASLDQAAPFTVTTAVQAQDRRPAPDGATQQRRCSSIEGVLQALGGSAPPTADQKMLRSTEIVGL